MSPACFCPHQVGRSLASWYDEAVERAAHSWVRQETWSTSNGLICAMTWSGERGPTDRSRSDGSWR